ncbi:hypothetical protein EOE67_06490 [Rheinheimera riviphila]|uniref:DUF2225 domain-containing protein n=1 Tax=Rheinheimera riviphila TaxID=1834037 RepID=A0A437R0H7_9GAMM|nr:hypothetical protein [Rheinheimera riviphila]RVU40240.1 hypothetical protein EOE67_06490 [Rheinheimera riviphila]
MQERNCQQQDATIGTRDTGITIKGTNQPLPGSVIACGVCQHPMKTARTIDSDSPADLSVGINLENDVGAPTGYGYLLSIIYCQKCGFATTALNHACPDDIRALVHSIPYQLQWSDESLPKLARVFLCKAILDLSRQQLCDAAYSALAAAWVCDELADKNAAIWCRKVTAEYFRRYFSNNPRLDSEQQRMLFHYVDVCHRAGLLQRARQLCRIIAQQQLDAGQQQHLTLLQMQLGQSDVPPQQQLTDLISDLT